MNRRAFLRLVGLAAPAAVVGAPVLASASAPVPVSLPIRICRLCGVPDALMT